MSKHTPGPWAYTVDAHGDDLQITAGDQTVVGGCGCCGSPSMDNPADAPLLAAAPDLLETLKAIVDEFGASIDLYQRIGPHWTHKDGTEVFEVSVLLDRAPMIDAARAAIAKAEDQK